MKDTKGYLGDIRKTKFHHFPLQPQLLNTLRDINVRRPTQVQADSLEISLQENLKQLCILVYAYNGSGKTLSYLIPVVHSLTMIPCQGVKQGNTQHKISRPQALIIVPTIPLLQQVQKNFLEILSYYKVHYNWQVDVGTVYGKNMQKGHILVGLVYKMTVLLEQPYVDLSQLKWVIFDECDMIQQNSRVQFTNILKTFSKKNLKTNFLITSATSNKTYFRQFIQKNLTTHNLIELDSRVDNKSLQGVTHYYTDSNDNKNMIILDILQAIASRQLKMQVIIFFNETRDLEALWKVLHRENKKFLVNDPQADLKGKNNIKVGFIHGNCENSNQEGNLSKLDRMEMLRQGEFQVMLATQIIGRGIDIRTVTLVINYEDPTQGKNKQLSPTAYIHRVGRTGRYSDQGIALVFLKNKLFLNEVEKQFNIKMKPMENIETIVKEAAECFNKNRSMEEDDSNLRWALT